MNNIYSFINLKMSKNDDNQDKEEIITQNSKGNNIDTIMNLKFDPENENQANNPDITTNKDTNIDGTMIALNADQSQKNMISKLNIQNKQEDKNDEKKNEKKAGFMQNTKSWFNKAWNNIKNYDYSKWNIFKGEEMEECLDAHGFPMKIPKKKHQPKPKDNK